MQRDRIMMRFVGIAVVTAACDSRPRSRPQAAPPIATITACPDGAVMAGAAPPAGLRQRCQKSEGVRHGASREWYDAETERSYSEWWDGNKHGRFKLWFKTGKLRSEGAHRHGVPAGRWRSFSEDGSLQQDQRFPVEPPPEDWLARALAGQPPP